MKSNKLESVLEEVHAKRQAGYNCAEGAFWGISRLCGLKQPCSCVTGFGGGVAGSGSVCGALCGAIAAIGVYTGRIGTEQAELKEKCLELSRAAAAGFIDGMGTQLCREILGYMPGNKPPHLQFEGINPQCRQAVALAVKLAFEIIEADRARLS